MSGSTYHTPNYEVIDISAQFPHSTTAVAKMLTHPKVNGNIKLRRFLSQEGIFINGYPDPGFEDLGYFKVVYRARRFGQLDPVIKVSDAGVEFIKNQVRLKLEVVKSASI